MISRGQCQKVVADPSQSSIDTVYDTIRMKANKEVFPDTR